MSKNKRAFHWSLGLASVLTAIGLTVLAEDNAFAQITPDSTLGVEGSVVNSNVDVKGLPAELIAGGANRGANLFHSFLEFNIGEGQRVYFANPAQIENILSRVTGNNLSNILGTLGVLGNANLFFINPNGILFGRNAQLDIRGSFVASTANSLVFNNGFEFSATNPQAPPLLTVNVTPGLQYGINQPEATITNTGRLIVGQDLTLSASNLDLQGELNAGKDLTLQAQNTVQVRDSATLFSGRDMVFQAPVRILGNASYTTGGYFITQQPDGAIVDFLIPHDKVIKADGDVSLADDYNDQSLYILAGGKVTLGNVTITQAGNETITESISNGMGGMQTISINASDRPTLDVRAGIDWNRIPGGFPGNTNTSGVEVIVSSPTTADITSNGHKIQIQQPDGLVFLTNQFQPNNLGSDSITVSSINTSVRGKGNGGSVFIDSRDEITVNGEITSNIFISNNTDGNGGDVNLLAKGNINLNAPILSRGLLGGNITLKSEANIFVAGNLSSQSFSFLSPTRLIASPPGSTGGDITIMAGGDITFSPGLGLSASSTSDTANAGSVFIGAGGKVSFNNEKDSIENISVTSFVERPNSRTNGSNTPNGGNITIKGRLVSLFNTKLDSHTDKRGDAGDITIEATDGVIFDGESRIVSQVKQETVGNGGNIKITIAPLGSVQIINGSFLEAGTLGEGNAGRIDIQAPGGHVEITDKAFLNSQTQAGGRGSDISITTGSLTISNGARLFANTLGQGDAGNITITATNATGTVSFDNSRVFTSVGLQENGTVLPQAEGNGGTIEITAPELSLTNGAILSASTASANTSGKGKAGAIIVNANQINLFRAGSSILAETEGTAAAGELKLQPYGSNPNLNVNFSDNAQISASTSGSGTGGQITVTAPEAVTISGKGTLSTETTGSGLGGTINITTPKLTIEDATISASTSGTGSAGNILVQGADSISLSNSLISTAVNPNAIGDGGTINLQTRSLSLNDSQISASTFGTGNAGNISVQNANSVSLINNSLISTEVKQGAIGNGGNIDLQTRSLSLDNAKLRASSDGQGDAGSITVRDSDTVSLVDNSLISTETSNTGKAGDITITTGTITVEDSQVSATTTSMKTVDATGGRVNINANQVNLSGNNSGLLAKTEGVANAGDLKLQPNGSQTLNINLSDGATISASTSNRGKGGNLRVIAPEAVTISGNGQLSADTTGSGQAGNIDIQTETLDVQNGARISASTSNSGAGGNITVIAPEAVTFRGNSQLSTDTTGTGQGGKIAIATDALTIDGATISASSSGQGNAGSITIDTQKLIAQNGAKISAATRGSGLGGNILITADNFEANSGAQFRTTTSGSNNAGNIIFNVQDAFSLVGEGTGLFANTEEGSSGNGGSIFIDPRTVIIRDGAKIAVDSQGTGEGGNILIQAGSFILDNGIISADNQGTGKGGNIEIQTGSLTLDNGTISATTASNTGGDIILDVQDLFRLRHGSKVSTTAGNAQAGGDGGNINIKARFIIASPNEDNDITANAFNGNGGRINIETQGIFGIEERRAIPGNKTNDIDASSEFGLNGVVTINRLDTDPNQGLVELPDAPVNLEPLQACQADVKRASSFVDTRRGGLPSNPHEISSNTVWEDTRSPSPSPSVQSLPDSSPAKQIVEAQGWIVDADGKVILTTQASTATPDSRKIAIGCQVSR